MITSSQVGKCLAAHSPAIDPAVRASAAVAIVLRERHSGLEILFIERARHDSDPWSGDIAFPGGRLEKDDVDPRSAAERETGEEIDLDLGTTEYLGRLSDLTTADERLVVAAFVYCVEGAVLRLSSEVADAFWTPVSRLLDPSRQSNRIFRHRGVDRVFPTIDLLGPGRPVLWGVTYRFVSDLLGLLDHPVPTPPP